MALTANGCDEVTGSGLGADRAEAFAQAYVAYWPRLVSLCRSRLPDRPDEAEALAQEAFTRAWASFERFSTDRPFWPWVSTIARRLAVDFRRELGRDTRIELRVRGHRTVAPWEPEEMFLGNEECRTALDALRSLRARERRLVELHHLHGWSYEQIAGFEASSVEAVRAVLKRARPALRQAYERLSGGAAALYPMFRGIRRRVAAAGDSAARLATRLPIGTGGTAADVATMAVLVGVVAVGFPSSVPVSQAFASATTPVTAATFGAPTGAPTVAEVARGGAPSRTANSEAAPRPAPGAAPPTTLGVLAPVLENPDDSHPDEGMYQGVTAAPDGSVFAVGQHQDNCHVGLSSCHMVFRSTDGGETWSRLPAIGYLGGELLFPPTYPSDPRIFTTTRGLQVSHDAGRTFATVAPLAGPGAVAPDFSAGKEHVYIGAAPGWVYDASTGALRLADLSAVAANPPKANVAFSPSYATDRTVFVGAYGSTTLGDKGVDTFHAVHRCREGVCQELFRANKNAVQAPLHVKLPPNHGDSGVVWARSSFNVWRSRDFGHTFESVPLPVTALLKDLAVTDAGAYLALLDPYAGRAGLFYLPFDAPTWRRIGAGTVLEQGAAAITVLPTGRLVAAAHGAYRGAGRLLWSDDHGANWHAGR